MCVYVCVCVFRSFNFEDYSEECTVLCLVAQLCLTLWEPIDYSLPGSSVHGDSPGKNTGVSFHALLQGIFPRSQGLNPGLPHCRPILYHLSYQGSPWILEWVPFSLLQGNFPTQESNQGLLHCWWILYQLSYQGSLKNVLARIKFGTW